MKTRSTLAAFAAALLAASAASTGAMAAGFRLPEAGAKAMGMAFAFTAQANDPSAIYFNPAGITQLEGTNAKAGVTYVKENGQTFTGETTITLADGVTNTEVQKDLNFYIPNAFVTHKDAGSRLAYGLGVFVPFGLGQEYENKGTSIFRGQTTKIDLQTVVINPTVAYQLHEAVSIGAGIDFMYGRAKLARKAVYPADNATNLYNLNLEGDGTAWGYNFGILLMPSKSVRLGLSYRSPFTLKIKDGDVEIRDINATAVMAAPAVTSAQVFGGTSFDTKGDATVRMPATAALGLAILPTDRLTVEADLDWTFWSSYRSLPIDVRNNNPLLPDSNSAKEWNDVCAFRIGGEYRVTDPLALRLGFAYDPTPVPDSTMGAELPDATRLNYTAGVGYKVGPLTIDAAYFYLQKKDRTVSNIRLDENGRPTGFNGTWEGDAHLVALDLGYKF